MKEDRIVRFRRKKSEDATQKFKIIQNKDFLVSIKTLCLEQRSKMYIFPRK